MVTEHDPLEARIVQVLTHEGLWLATAESCTGGLIAHRITSVPGASECFLGGVVAYSNTLKTDLLGVSPGTLAAGGGSPEKPVGLVFIAVAWTGGCDVARHAFSGTREDVKQQTADTALAMVWERIQ